MEGGTASASVTDDEIYKPFSGGTGVTLGKAATAAGVTYTGIAAEK